MLRYGSKVCFVSCILIVWEIDIMWLDWFLLWDIVYD